MPSVSQSLDSKTDSLQIKNPADPNAGQRLKEAETVAKEFESLFMDQIVKGMRKTVPTDESSNALGIYTDMLDSEHAKTMTESREFGIRQMIMDWMKTADPKIQEEATNLSLKAKQGNNPGQIDQLTTLRNSARRFLE